MQKLIDKMLFELKLRNYSKKTLNAYSGALKSYFLFKKSNFHELDIQNIRHYLLHLQYNNRASSTLNLHLGAIKFFYSHILKKSTPINIKFPRRQKRLPIVLSRQEIRSIIACIKNAKHQILIALAYAAGMRVSEIINLKIADINFDDHIIHLKQAKGNKDRVTIFPERLIPPLRKLSAGKKPNDYLISSERGGHLTTRTAQKIFKNACKKAAIQRPATFHSLRHSFATHLLEDGVDIRYVQALLGHNNIRTTERYTQVTNPHLKNIASPFNF